MKPVVPRKEADNDIDRAIRYYAKEAPHVVDDLIAAFEEIYTQIGDAPKTGSPRYAARFGIPGLRFKTVRRFPYVVLYIEHTHFIDVIRVLHQHRDIPGVLLGE